MTASQQEALALTWLIALPIVTVIVGFVVLWRQRGNVDPDGDSQ